MAALLEAELPESRRRGAHLHRGGRAADARRHRDDAASGLLGSIDDSNAAAALVGGGAVATLFGVSMFSPRLVRPLASFIGWPLERLRGLTGRLARENAVRKPGRTAVTAGALMIGLAVVVFVTVFAAGISASVGNAIDRNFQGDIVLQNTDGFSPISSGAGREAEQVRGREDGLVAELRRRRVQGQGHPRVGGRPGHRLRRAVARLEAGLARHALVAVRRRRGAGRRLGQEQRHRAWATRIAVRTPLERAETLHGRGHGQGQRRPARQPGRDRATLRSAVRHARAEHDVHQARPAAPTPTRVKDEISDAGQARATRPSRRSTSRS